MSGAFMTIGKYFPQSAPSYAYIYNLYKINDFFREKFK